MAITGTGDCDRLHNFSNIFGDGDELDDDSSSRKRKKEDKGRSLERTNHR